MWKKTFVIFFLEHTGLFKTNKKCSGWINSCVIDKPFAKVNMTWQSKLIAWVKDHQAYSLLSAQCTVFFYYNSMATEFATLAQPLWTRHVQNMMHQAHNELAQLYAQLKFDPRERGEMSIYPTQENPYVQMCHAIKMSKISRLKNLEEHINIRNRQMKTLIQICQGPSSRWGYIYHN
jgi:hypothetical protein